MPRTIPGSGRARTGGSEWLRCREPDLSHRPHYAADPEARLTGRSRMSFAFLGPYHPQIVHTPIVLLIFSAFFGILARLMDRDWLRKMSVTLLVFGFLGAF